MTPIKKICQNCDKEFLIINQEQVFYEHKGLAPPTDCFACRRVQRGRLRNQRHLYSRHCDHCGISLISTYPKDSPYIIYCEKCYIDDVN